MGLGAYLMYGMPLSETERIVALETSWTGRAMRRARPKTLSIIIGNGTVDVPVVWREGGVVTPMPTDAYGVTIADTLPSNCTAAVLGTRTAAGCTIRITATGGLGLAIGTELDLTAWT